jgi:hypothetical protein
MGTGTVWAVKDMMQTVEWEKRGSRCIKNTATTITQTHTHSETLLRRFLSVFGGTPENIL